MIGLEGNTGASTGTLTDDDEGVKFLAIYGVPALYYVRTSENVRIRARAFGVKRTGVYTSKRTGVRTDIVAKFFRRGIVYAMWYSTCHKLLTFFMWNCRVGVLENAAR